MISLPARTVPGALEILSAAMQGLNSTRMVVGGIESADFEYTSAWLLLRETTE